MPVVISFWMYYTSNNSQCISFIHVCHSFFIASNYHHFLKFGITKIAFLMPKYLTSNTKNGFYIGMQFEPKRGNESGCPSGTGEDQTPHCDGRLR